LNRLLLRTNPGILEGCNTSGCPKQEYTGQLFSSLRRRRGVGDIVYLYKLLNNLEDNQYLRAKITFRVKGVTRKKDMFYLGFSRNSLGYNSPLQRMCRLANSNSEIIDLFFTSVKDN
jgi:hypothetical protein